MIDVPLKQIDRAVIEALTANGVSESQDLEYKEKLPGGNNEEKKEFLADVSAMANAVGGDIVYGIAERRDNGRPTGTPERVAGLAAQNSDSETLRLENILRNGIDPRINGCEFQWVKGFDTGAVLVLRIPPSSVAPHMVNIGDSRFYSRSSTGKYPLNVPQIRAAFALSESRPERAKRFCDERLENIGAEESPWPLSPNPKIVLHLVPLGALGAKTRIDLAAVERLLTGTSALIHPGGSHNLSSRHNLDGFRISGQMGPVLELGGYLQVFRDGAIEAFDSTMLSRHYTGDPRFHSPDHPDEFAIHPLIPAVAFEKTLIEALTRYIRLLRELGVSPPIAIMLSLIGAQGYRLELPESHIPSKSPDSVKKNELRLDGNRLETFENNADKLLQPAFDTLWQCVGFDRDLLYMESGKGKWSIHSDGKPSI